MYHSVHFTWGFGCFYIQVLRAVIVFEMQCSTDIWSRGEHEVHIAQRVVTRKDYQLTFAKNTQSLRYESECNTPKWLLQVTSEAEDGWPGNP